MPTLWGDPVSVYAVHPLAPANRWPLIEPVSRQAHMRLARQELRKLGRREGWWRVLEVQDGGREVVETWTPPGYRKPWACLVVTCEDAPHLGERERARQYRARRRSA